MLNGFKKFLMRGNVVDLAVAVVVGTAFTKVVGAFVDGIITPLVAAIFGKPDYEHLTFMVNNAVFSYGLLINALLTFLFTAAAVYFAIVLPLNHFAERRRVRAGIPEQMEEPEESEKELLAQIRDLLQERAH